ncbi:MAG: sodium:calcium antiporter [Planctomycetes bacterium]|nr:sodium:calcium antiporter [Planctomycetota bacterium]
MLGSVLLYAVVALVSTAVIWVGSALLERSADRLSRYYQLPEIVQGAVVVAVGSSFPELSTTVLSTLVHGEFELGLSAIVGSAIFNILVIPGLSGLAVPNGLSANRDVVYKEAQFYMIAVAVLLLTFSFGAIYHPVGPGPGGGGAIQGEVGRVLALIPIGAYGLYIFLQYQDTKDYDAPPVEISIHPLKEWGILLFSLVIILAGVEGLVRSAVEFGALFETPTFLWGITVVAAGTSVPDAFVSIRAARAGHATTSLANVFGSNVFDLLIAIPAGILIAGSVVVNYSIAAPMLGVLTLGTVILFVMLRTGLSLSRRESAALLALYALFVVWISAESAGWIDLVPSLPPEVGEAH